MSNVNAGTNVSNATRKLVFAAMGVALAMVTSYIKVWKMPMGGSVTLLSMLFVSLIGYWFGPKFGVMTGVAYGILQLIVDPYMVSLPQILLDYPVAFGALGLSGFFADKKHGLQIGYITGVFGRFVFSTLSGVIFFADYAPEGTNPWLYSATYQGSYLGIEAVLTLVVISLPPIVKVLHQIKMQSR